MKIALILFQTGDKTATGRITCCLKWMNYVHGHYSLEFHYKWRSAAGLALGVEVVWQAAAARCRS